MFAHSKASLVIAAALAMSSCVKPQNHDSKVDESASFYADEVKGVLDTAETVPGFGIPSSRLYTFTTCLKDRRTDESLPGAPFTVSGGDRELDIHTNKDGCAVWSEKIAFDYLANEKYLPITRTITAKGSQVGARTLRLAINPWVLTKDAPPLWDLDHHPDIPTAQVASEEQAHASMSTELAGGTPRKLFIDQLPLKNSSVSTTDGSIARSIKVYLNPSMNLTGLLGIPQKIVITAAAGKLKVTAALIESITSGGQESKTVVAKTSTPIVVEDGKTSADLKFTIAQGSDSSRYFLALKVEAVDGPKGLLPFEGLFSIGDRNSVTSDGAATGELKTSNNDSSFSFETALSSAASLQTQSTQNQLDARTVRNGGGNTATGPVTNAGNGNNLKTFSISNLTPIWSGKTLVDLSNSRTIGYHVRTCIDDISNGGKPAAGIEFSVKLANGTWTKMTTSTMKDQAGCVEWEDQITHRFYEPEHFFIIPVTIKHSSGYQETREYAIDPWQPFNFTADPVNQKQYIQNTNANAAGSRSYFIAGGVSFNMQGTTRYEVDNYMNLTAIKRVSVRIPMQVARPSNLRDGINAIDALRAGKYLLKAAYVAPQSNITSEQTHLAVSTMVGTNRIVQSRAGSIFADIEIPVSDITLMNSRAYFVFEVYLLDEMKLPANALSLSGPDLMKYVDRSSDVIMPTFAGVMSLRTEKDSTDIVWPAAELGRNPMNAAGIAARNSVQPLINKTVDQLNAEAATQAETSRRNWYVQSRMGVVARRANAEFAYVQNEGTIFAKTPDKILMTNNQILPPANHAVDALLRTLNTPLSGMGASTLDGQAPLNITKDVLLGQIQGGKGMDPKFAAQLCGYFFNTLLRTKVQGLNWNKVELGFNGKWANECLAQLRTRTPDETFSIDHRLRVLEKPQVVSQHGRNDLTLSTGASFGLYSFNQVSQGWGGSFGSGGVTSEIARTISRGNGGKIIRVFTSILGGLGIEFSKSSSSGNMAQGGYTFGVNQSFTVEQMELGVVVPKSDECLVVRPKPTLFNGILMQAHLKMLKSVLGENQSEALMNRGLMICTGAVNSQPRRATERYYTMNTVNSATTTNDPWDIRNMPWLLQLRGQHDFGAFMVIASASKDSKPNGNVKVELGDLSQQSLQNAYDTYFAGKMSTMPGFVTLEGKIISK